METISRRGNYIITSCSDPEPSTRAREEQAEADWAAQWEPTVGLTQAEYEQQHLTKKGRPAGFHRLKIQIELVA